jgi:hypothetical protein
MIRSVSRLLTDVMALAADTLAISVHVAEFVATHAAFLARVFSTTGVHRLGDNLHVFWVDTSALTAQVVHCHSSGDQGAMQLPGEPVGIASLLPGGVPQFGYAWWPSMPKSSIAALHPVAAPEPTLFSLFNFLPETFAFSLQWGSFS